MEINMKQNQLEQYEANKSNRKDMFCANCNQIYRNTNMIKCGLCGKRLTPYTNNLPKCPTCDSTNISKISATSKAIGVATFGIFSKTAFFQFKCNNCGYKW